MKYKLFFLLLIFTSPFYGQTIKDGETYFNNKQYAKARSVYDELLKKRPNDVLYNYKYARCCYEMKDYDGAIIHFEKTGSKFPLSYSYLGELYFLTYHFDESASSYQKFISTLNPTDNKTAEFLVKEKKAENAARLLSKVEVVSIVDSMVVNKDAFLKFYKLNKESGSLSQESIQQKGHHRADKIKYMTQRQDREYFSDTIKGHMNIFTSYKLLDGWSQPVSISDKINSSANVNYPFLLADGVTVYFASDGENSIGGYDLFITRYNPSTNSYLAPENIGMPFNSPYNDYMMVIDDQHKLGWFASDRYQPSGKVMIYKFIPQEEKTYVHSDDKDYIRRVAQLKSYQKATDSISIGLKAIDNQQPALAKQIEFVINDSLVYTNVKQFKSKEAVRLWTDLHSYSIELNNKAKELSDLRAKYAKMDNEPDRAAIAPKIIELEKMNIDMKKQLSDKTIQVRNEEIKFLNLKK